MRATMFPEIAPMLTVDLVFGVCLGVHKTNIARVLLCLQGVTPKTFTPSRPLLSTAHLGSHGCQPTDTKPARPQTHTRGQPPCRATFLACPDGYVKTARLPAL
jgi:hypothetical protein